MVGFFLLFWCKASIYGARMFSHTNLHFGEIIIFRSWDLSVQCYSLVSFTSVYTPPRGIHIDGLSMFGTRIRRSCHVNVPQFICITMEILIDIFIYLLIFSRSTLLCYCMSNYFSFYIYVLTLWLNMNQGPYVTFKKCWNILNVWPCRLINKGQKSNLKKCT